MLNRSALIGTIAIVALLGAAFVLNSAKTNPPAPDSGSSIGASDKNLPPDAKTDDLTKKTITLKEIQRETYSFLKTLRFMERLHAEKLNGEDPKVWWLGDTLKSPIAAWLILAHARMRNLDPDAVPMLEQDLDQWTKGADGSAELYSIHQLYEAYKISGHPMLLNWFWSRIDKVENLAEKSFGKGTLPRSSHVALAATLARELTQAAYSLSQEKDLALLKEFGKFSPSTNPEQEILNLQKSYLSTAETLLTLVKNLNSDSNTKLWAPSGPPQFICWELWVESEMYRATGKQQYLGNITKYFGQLQQAIVSGQLLAFKNAQAFLPCIQIAGELKAENTLIGSTRTLLIQEYVVKYSDFSSKPICDGSGGLLANLNESGTCLNEIKSGADNSWLVFLIEPEELSSEYKLH